MTGVRITVNDREVQEALRSLLRLGREPGAFLRPLGQQLITSTRRRADQHVSPEGLPWRPLNPDYRLTKRGSKILRETGSMLGSLTREVEGSTLRVGTGRIYAAIHQFGGAAGRSRKVNIPARPWLGLSKEDLVMIREEFEEFAARAVRRR